MKSRAIWSILLAGVVSMSSGCYCLHNCFPNVGWRFHQHGCGGCAPACTSACSSPAPVAFGSGPVVPGGPGCSSCAAGALPPPIVTQPAGYTPAGYTPAGYPPVIGSPMPIPGPTIIPSSELPVPMPVKKTNGQ